MIKGALRLQLGIVVAASRRLYTVTHKRKVQQTTREPVQQSEVQEAFTNTSKVEEVGFQPEVGHVDKPKPHLTFNKDIVKRLHSLWKMWDFDVLQFRSQDEYEEEVMSLASLLLTDRTLDEATLIEAVRSLKQLTFTSDLPQNNLGGLRESIRNHMKNPHNKKIISTIAKGILSDKYSALQLLQFIVVMDYLPAEAGAKMLHKMEPLLPHLNDRNLLLLVDELIYLPYDLEVPTSTLLKTASHQFSVFRSIDSTYLLFLLMERYNVQRSPALEFYLYRMHPQPMKGYLFSYDQLLKIARCHCIEAQVFNKFRKFIQLRNNRSKVLSMQNYFAKPRSGFGLILKMHLEFSKVMYIGDSILMRIVDRFNQIEFKATNNKLVLDCLEQLTTEMNVLNYTTVADAQVVPHISEYVPACSSKILKLFGLLMKGFIEKTCPQILFRFNTPGKESEENQESANLDTFGYARGIDHEVPLVRVLLKVTSVADMSRRCLAALKWEQLKLSDIKNIAKFLANNSTVFTATVDQLELLWKHFLRLSNTDSSELNLDFLYYAALLDNKLLEKSVAYFTEQLLPHLQLTPAMRQTLDNPVMSIVVSVRELNYLIPFLRAAASSMQSNRIQEILQQHEPELARLVNRWDSQLLRLNLVCLKELHELLPGYQPGGRLMEALVRNMSVFLVYIRSKKFFLVKHSLVDEEFVGVLKWLLEYSWEKSQYPLRPFTTVGLQAAVNHLYKHMSVQNIDRFIKIVGSDRRFYLPETIKCILGQKIEGATSEEIERLHSNFEDAANDSQVLTGVTAPPREDAPAADYEQYLKKALHQRSSKYVPRHHPKSREEKLLSVCLGISSQIEKQTDFGLSHHTDSVEISVDLNKYRLEIGEIFGIAVANLDENQPIKIEAVDEHYHSTKIEYLDGAILTKYEETLHKYTTVSMPIYSAAEETLRGLMFGQPSFIEVANHMHPPSVMASIVVELIRLGVKYHVHGPIVALPEKNIMIVTASLQSWRIRLVWSYILEREGNNVVMINTNEPLEVIQMHLQSIMNSPSPKK